MVIYDIIMEKQIKYNLIQTELINRKGKHIKLLHLYIWYMNKVVRFKFRVSFHSFHSRRIWSLIARLVNNKKFIDAQRTKMNPKPVREWIHFIYVSGYQISRFSGIVFTITKHYFCQVDSKYLVTIPDHNLTSNVYVLYWGYNSQKK